MADFGKFLCKKESEIVSRFFVNLYIRKIFSICFKIMCKNYRFMCKMCETSISAHFFTCISVYLYYMFILMFIN